MAVRGPISVRRMKFMLSPTWSICRSSYSSHLFSLPVKAQDMGVSVTSTSSSFLTALGVSHCQIRNYAKGKDKKGRSSIETLPVLLEGDEYPLNEVAQVSRKSSQMLIINAAAFPQATVGIMSALQESGMKLNPQQEGTKIIVPLPKVTKDHRENLAKSAKTLYNQCRDHLRDIQNHHIRKLKKKEGEVSEDLIHNVQLKIQEIAKSHMQEAEKIMTLKQKELLQTN
ncbi:ribosome-recycling factor isoform X2 [Panulirus ornatus]|uniref:ribosome-recycling factor isoform X2 n=1 Tax=Panulirus ornatus TaxID=150431 RepID=UPI003A86001C